MWFLLAVGCSGPEPEVPSALPPERAVPESALPTVRPGGVREVVTPPEVTRASDVREAFGAGWVDVCFNPDVTTFDALGSSLDAWALTRTDGDGACWRVAAPSGSGPLAGAERLAAQLSAAPGVAAARAAVTVEPLPSGEVREGEEHYGGLVHAWSIGPDGPKAMLTGGAAVPAAVLPTSLAPGARACLAPILEDMAVGISTGAGWERALVTSPRSWGLVLEEGSFCRATGWLALRADAPADSLRIGEDSAASIASDSVAELAARFLATPHAEEDPLVLAALDTLAAAPDAILARAVRDAAPGETQRRLLAAFADRSPEAAVALAGGAVSPTLRAEAVGQDEQLRAQVIADPAAPASVVAAALAIWRPGPSDGADVVNRFLTSPSPEVRARAWNVRAEATTGICRHRVASATKVDAAEALYRECPQLDVRERALATVMQADRGRGVALLSATLEAPETPAAGIAAVTAAAMAGETGLLKALVARRSVDRTVRAVALNELLARAVPGSEELLVAHGAFLGVDRDEIAPATAGVDG